MKFDFFVFDTEQLKSLADNDTVKQGLKYYNEQRVFDLVIQPDRILAQVEGSNSDFPYEVELVNHNEKLQCFCSCYSEKKVCKHGITVLYKISEVHLNEQQEKINGAVGEAIKERVKKGRNEVNVKLLKGNLVFGVWEAQSILSATYRKTTYHVHIRSLQHRMNYCTCPDLATNQLGTCKHIEAVLHYAKKQADYNLLKVQGIPLTFVYLAWESAADPVIKLQKAHNIDHDLNAELAVFFDQRNRFKGRFPDDFHYFSERFNFREDIVIGEDALAYVRQCAEDAAQQIRAQQISQQILQYNGILPGIKVRLFPYQNEGVAFLASRGRALLADDMGLGKTLQAISAANWLSDHAGVTNALVVCPTSLKHQWAREIAKFTGKPVQIIQGPAEGRDVQYRADALFYIINYELVMRDLSVINESLNPDLLILDEAQRIKNWRTKIASTIKLIPSRYAFVLTGTPLENRIEDLYSLLQVVDPRILGPLWRCLLDYHVCDERGKVIGYRNLSELRKRISGVMLRRNRSLVSEQLPDKTEVRLDIPMTKQQKEIHDSAMSSAGQLADIAKKRPLTPSESNRLMAALQQARMACNAVGLVDKKTTGSPKLDELSNLLEELCLQSNRKVVVFSQWALMTEMVESLAHSLKLGCVRLHGGVPSHKRGELTEKFEQDDAVQLFISTDAGGVGLNLQSATALINLDMPWNPAVLDQRIARIHRLGQRNKVQIFLLLAEDAYEQQVARLVQNKRDLFDNVVSPEATEDVVGISKKMLESIIDDLSEPQASSETLAESQEPAPIDHSILAETPVKKKIKQEMLDDNSVKQLIIKLQTAIEQRLERILASAGGLLVIVHYADAGDDALAQQLSEDDVPIAIISAKTYADLQRLGQHAPIINAETVYDGTQEQTTECKNPLMKLAEEKLRAAETLTAQQCYTGVMDLLAASLLAAITSLSQQEHIPSIENSTVWLYSEIVPKQLLNEQQAATVIRIVSLSQALEIPYPLVEQALHETQELLIHLQN